MIVPVIEEDWASSLVEQDLYFLPLVLSGLEDVESTLACSLFGRDKFCTQFEVEFNLEKLNWVGRRTTRQLKGEGLDKYQKAELYRAINFIANHTKVISMPVSARKLTAAETEVLVNAFSSQAVLDERAFCIGFFTMPDSFSSVRDNWVFVGAVSQLLCVLAHKLNCCVFLSHGIEQLKHSYPLCNLEYVLFFNRENENAGTENSNH